MKFDFALVKAAFVRDKYSFQISRAWNGIERDAKTIHVLKTSFQPRLSRRRDHERCEKPLASSDFRIMEQGRSPPVEKIKRYSP